MIGEGFDIVISSFCFPSSYAEIRIDRETDSTSRFNEGEDEREEEQEEKRKRTFIAELIVVRAGERTI